MSVKINFVTHNPLNQGSPFIYNKTDGSILVELSDNDKKILNPIVINLEPNQYYIGPYQYYVDWNIKISDYKNKTLIEEHNLNLKDQVVFIKMDARALGDNLAWMPYVEEFRKKHDCKIICSTFWNNLFIDVYPEIMFVKPNTRIDNVYAQYYIGTHDNTPPCYSPTTYLTEPLQKIAADILGLEFKYSKCEVNHIKKPKNPKKICLSQYASLDMKTWHGDWQKIVDVLIEKGYEVHVISLEPNKLKNVIDKTGDFPIEHRVAELTDASYFIGVSSGLSWLAHSLDCHVFLISDFTPSNHEFNSNVTRIYGNEVRTKIKYEYIKNEITTQEVLSKIKQILK
jgi:autotransporter strand-loop-strand O-heptosyltransferase